MIRHFSKRLCVTVLHYNSSERRIRVRNRVLIVSPLSPSQVCFVRKKKVFVLQVEILVSISQLASAVLPAPGDSTLAHTLLTSSLQHSAKFEIPDEIKTHTHTHR